MTILAIIFLGSLLFGQLVSLFPGFEVSIYLHDVTLFILLTVFASKLIRRRRVIQPRLVLPITLFTITALVSLLANAYRLSFDQLLESFLYLVRWVFYAFVYVAVVQQIVPVTYWLYGLFAVGTLFSLVGLFQFWLYPALQNLSYLGWDPYFYRLFSTLFDPNFTGIIIILTLLLGLFILKTTPRRLGIQLLLLVNGIALLLTFSRGSYIAMIIASIVYGFGYRSWKLTVGFLGALIVLILIPKPPWEAFQIFRSISSAARFHNWIASFMLFLQSPFIGFGFNSLKYIQFPIATPGIASRAGAGIDNSFLFLLDTTGLVGFTVFIGLTQKMYSLGIRLSQLKKTKNLGTVYIAMLAAVFAHSMFTNSLFYPWVMLWLWILTGVVEVYLNAGKSHAVQQ